MKIWSRITLCLVFLLAILGNATHAAEQPKWWKGNLHTHTLWSDGDDYPEMVANWYKDQGYNFLALSDHNVLLDSTKWLTITNTPKKELAFNRYLESFGSNWVVQRSLEGKRQVRLKTLTEFRGWFEEPERFLLVPSEELSASYKQVPIHLNISNVRELVQPQHGTNVLDVIQRSIDAVVEQRKKTGQPILVHVNHPNFGWAIPAETLMQVQRDRFFEVYNGHGDVKNAGDKIHASVERVWDIILTFRLTQLNLPAMFGLAVDDSHNYLKLGPGNNNPGRGWIMVRSAKLAPGDLFEAMEKGDFYASTGVRLSDMVRAQDHISLSIEGETNVTYVTQFIGTLKGFDASSEQGPMPTNAVQGVTRRYSEDIGKVLAEVPGTNPEYRFKGNEIYVRAKVISSKKRSFPHPPAENEVAWIQPVAVIKPEGL